MNVENSFSVEEVTAESGLHNWLITWKDKLYMAKTRPSAHKAIEHCLSPGVGKHSVGRQEDCPVCKGTS